MEKQLLSKESLDLIEVMKNLANQNRELAVTFAGSHHESRELEDDQDYVDVQSHIVQAIYGLGQLVGKNIAERII